MKRVSSFAVLVIALPLAGLSVAANAADCSKGKIKVYTSWPMQGAMLPEGTGMKNGVNLAVDQNQGLAGGYCVEVVNLDDASPQTGKWDGAVEAEDANKAVADPDAMVYIGGTPERSRWWRTIATGF